VTKQFMARSGEDLKMAKLLASAAICKNRGVTSEATRSKEINETGFNKNEPPRFEQDV
ncbi:hypothetical protein Tco_1158137, partial [Tanacetum coccineum]